MIAELPVQCGYSIVVTDRVLMLAVAAYGHLKVAIIVTLPEAKWVWYGKDSQYIKG